jgi:hypothetical protein
MIGGLGLVELWAMVGTYIGLRMERGLVCEC